MTEDSQPSADQTMRTASRFSVGDGLILSAVLVLIAILGGPAWRDARQGDPAFNTADIVEIRCSNEPPRRYPLNSDQTVTVACRLGASVIHIQHGKVRFLASPCTTHACVRAGWLSRTGDSAACLPNGVSLRLLSASPAIGAGADEDVIDAVSQ